MKKKGWGRIVTIGSVNQYNNHPELSIYGVTKEAQKKLMENIIIFFSNIDLTVSTSGNSGIISPYDSNQFFPIPLSTKSGTFSSTTLSIASFTTFCNLSQNFIIN